MTPKMNGNIGKLLSTFGIILGALGLILTALAPSIAPGDTHDVIYSAALFCVAISVYLAHKYGSE